MTDQLKCPECGAPVTARSTFDCMASESMTFYSYTPPTLDKDWVMVPREFTNEMRDAYNDACKHSSGEPIAWLVKAGWNALLAAAPTSLNRRDREKANATD